MGLKILLLSHRFYPDIGGIETISDILASEFFKAGHEVHLLTWSPDSSGKVFPFKVIRCPSKLRLFKEHIWADVVFENNPCLRLSWPGIFLPRPSIVGLQTWVARVNGKIGFQDKLKLLWLKRAKKVIACSEALRQRCWKKALVVGNPFHQDIFTTYPGITKKYDFVFLGRLVSDKGADLAIKAFAEIVKERAIDRNACKKSTLTIIGDGPERTNLSKLVAEIGLSEYVQFKGALRGRELVNCLNEFRYLLVPSLWKEPFGIVALEGMACGCIPVVSDGGGLPDAVGDAGLIFKRGDEHSLTACIRKVYNDSEAQRRLHDAAKNHLPHFYPSNVSRQYLVEIEKAVQTQ